MQIVSQSGGGVMNRGDVLHRRAWLVACFLAAGGHAASAVEGHAPARPNVVVILADDLGRADYGAFGTTDIRTPNIDRLGREGTTFRNFYANSCVCSPTRAALLTGCYPDRVGVPGVIRDETPENSWGYLAAHATLLPQRLKTAGTTPRSSANGTWAPPPRTLPTTEASTFSTASSAT